MPMKKGFFITLEGPEGSGKSSQGRWLAQRLRRAGVPTVSVRDPGSTALGRQLRRILLHSAAELSPLMEALMFIGGRVQLVEERIRPALADGWIVLCDRFHDATVAYQGFGGGLNVRWLDAFGRQAIHGIMPSLTILLDVPTERGFARLHRTRDRMERKVRTFHRRVREGYRRLARREPHRFVVIDASQPPERVRLAVERAVMHRLRRSSITHHQSPSTR